MDGLLLREDADWEQIREEHLVQVGFFQHERLIHLIVTVVFALFAVLSIGMAFLLMALGMEGAGTWLFVVAAFLVLLVPYVRHYYTDRRGRGRRDEHQQAIRSIQDT